MNPYLRKYFRNVILDKPECHFLAGHIGFAKRYFCFSSVFWTGFFFVLTLDKAVTAVSKSNGICKALLRSDGVGSAALVTT